MHRYVEFCCRYYLKQIDTYKFPFTHPQMEEIYVLLIALYAQQQILA